MTHQTPSASPLLPSTRRARTAVAAGLLGLLFGTPAAAAPAPAPGDGTILAPVGDVTATNVSGKGGYFRLAKGAAPSFLTALYSRERGDVPCANSGKVWFEKALSPRNPERETVSTFVHASKCSGTSRSARAAHVPSGSLRQLDGSVNSAAGVQVCMNSARTRVKGVRLFGANISATGQVTHSSAYDGEFERPNCSGTWETARRCPSDQVATAARFHYSGGALTGIALECQRVEVRTLATRP